MVFPGPFRPILLFIILAGIVPPTMAQVNCVPVFTKEYTGAGQAEAQAVKTLADGSFLVAGRATPDAVTTAYNGLVAKLSPSGALQWAFLVGGGGNDNFSGIAPLNDGGAILYGSTASYGHPESKAWLVRIDANGAVLWSRQLGSGAVGTDRMKAIRQFTDGDLVGTMNTNDSSSASDPVVFKMGLDGTLHWAHRFDNGDDDSFTSIAFSGDTVYTGGYSFQSGTKRAVITRIRAEDGAFLSSNLIFRDDLSYQEEITGLEVYNDLISYGLWEHKGTDPDFNFNAIVLVQTDLSDKPQFVRYSSNNGDLSMLIPLRTKDNGFLVLRPYKDNLGSPSIVKIDRYGLDVWGISTTPYYAIETNLGLDITPDNGLIAVGFYNNYFSNYRNLLHVVRTNSQGEQSSSCYNGGPGMYTDTLGYSQQPFPWNVQANLLPGLNETVGPAAISFAPALTSDCDSAYCTDATPLPPGCNKTYRIEYTGDQSSVLRDGLATADGGRLAVGQVGFDGFVMKVQQNGDLAWSKSYEQFYHNTFLRRVLRTTDGNYFVIGQDGWVLNHGGASDIVFMKLDDYGNFLWSKNISMSDESLDENVADIAATPDGGFVLLDVTDDGGPGVYSWLLRFDAGGNLVWKREFDNTLTTPVYRSVTCSSNAIFVESDSYNAYGGQKFGVDKVDLATGTPVWGNRYSIGTSGGVRANRICVINDSVYAFLYAFDQPPPLNTQEWNMLVTLDPQGNTVNSLTLRGDPVNQLSYNSNNLDQDPPTVTLMPDQDFVLCQPVSTGGVSMLNVTRIERDGSVLWSRNFPAIQNYVPYNVHPQGKGIVVSGGAMTTNSKSLEFDKGFVLRLDSSGQLQTGATADCQPVDRPFSVTPYSPVTIATTNNVQTIEPYNDGTILTASVLSQDVSTDATLLCYSTANCSAVVLQQKGQVCSNADTLVFFLDNSANCGAAATWTFDPTFFRPTQTTGDSIRLVPLQPGSSQVTADIEGYCARTTQQKTTAIVFSSTTPDLGPDTLLCKNSELTLHAGPGFATYQWNDNSTDSVLQVTAPGQYSVTTTDQCGDIHSASVQVKAANFVFHLTGDTVRCNNDAVLLQATGGYANYQWTPAYQISITGDSALVTPDVLTRYFVSTQKWPGCTLVDSVTVTPLSSPPIVLPANATICTGDSLLLDAGPAFSHYTWNNGDTVQEIFVKQAGKYSISALFSNGCSSRDSFSLSLYKDPQPALDQDPVLCKGADRLLDAGPGYMQYLWNDGSSGPTLLVTQTGNFWVTVTDQHGCLGSDTAHILRLADPPSGFLPADTTVCQYGGLVLTPKGAFTRYSWSDLSDGSSITIGKPGIYWVEVTDTNSCTATDTVLVAGKTCQLGVFVPTAFTPDRNGQNARFRALVYGTVSKFEFAVFGRWGQQVFMTQNPGDSWDGMIKGTPAPAGTYVWYCRYSLAGGPEELQKGTVILIR